ncbi:MAG: tRNA adenosine(34) deaminase TadA [Acutalibacteraceae bacterium]
MEYEKAFMQQALLLARQAYDDGEVPVGCVIVKDNEIIAVGRNRREKGKNALYHAEIEAINSACKALGGWRLWQCDMYVTLEPCPMCTGAIINARIKKLVYGAKDSKAGSCESVINLFDLPYNHKPRVISGAMEKECAEILSDFFKNLRDKRKAKNGDVLE